MTNKKRLLILIWNLGIGGMQKRVKDIVKDISGNRPEWEVYLLVKYKTPSCFNQEIEALPRVFVRYFPENHIIYNKWASLPWILKEVFVLRPTSCLTFLSHFSLLLLFAKFIFFWRRFGVILNEGVYTSKFLPIHSHNPELETRLIKIFYRYANQIIAPTAAIKNDLANNFSVPAGLISVIPNWTLVPPRRPLKPKYDLIYAGRFEREKNLFEMLEIVKAVKRNHPQIRLCLLGEGSLELKLRRRVDQLGLRNNVYFLFSQSDITSWLRRSKIFILTTLNEGLPNVILEAAMCQVPAAARYFEGAEEAVINGNTGYVVYTRADMLDRIGKLLHNAPLRKRMGEQAQRHAAKKFGYQNQKRFIDLLLDFKKHSLRLTNRSVNQN